MYVMAVTKHMATKADNRFAIATISDVIITEKMLFPIALSRSSYFYSSSFNYSQSKLILFHFKQTYVY